MAEIRNEARPSFDALFDVLNTIPKDRLVHLKHKLNCTRQDTRSRRLLKAMILLTLNREPEAMAELGDDVAAGHILKSHPGNMAVAHTIPLSSRHEEVALTVAHIYSLLVDEKLSCPLARNEAYRAAIKAYRDRNGVQKAKLNNLLNEARDKCGPDFTPDEMSYEVSPLRLDPANFPVQVTRNSPGPVTNSLDPRTLRSTGTPSSFISDFEISLSATVPFLTHSTHQPGIPNPSELSGGASNLMAWDDRGGASLGLTAINPYEGPSEAAMLENKSVNKTTGCHSTLLVSPHLTATLPFEKGVKHPVECTETPNTVAAAEPQDADEGKPANLQNSSLSSSLGRIPSTVKVSSSLPESTETGAASSSKPAPLPPIEPSLTDSQDDKRDFFTFVVLHANEDEAVACRVKERLESLGVSNGTTFSEDFLVPGHNQFSCLENALDNSAFTLLLLTKNFKTRYYTYQTSVALMDSLNRSMKIDSVIPFVPQENPFIKKEMPCFLATIVPLEEKSPVFTKRVKKTFKPEVIRQKKGEWKYRRWIQEQAYPQHLAALRINSPIQMRFPAQPAASSGLHPVPHDHSPYPFPLPTCPMLGQFQPQAFQSFPAPLGLGNFMQGGTQPHLIIQHAQMVQIGDHNHMQVEKTNAALGTAEDGAGESQQMEEGTRDRRKGTANNVD